MYNDVIVNKEIIVYYKNVMKEAIIVNMESLRIKELNCYELYELLRMKKTSQIIVDTKDYK